MDRAVALVETYLRVNGYLTVTEYPVLESESFGGYRTVTDLDVLAFRFPRAGRLVLKKKQSRAMVAKGTVFQPDSALRCPPDSADMLIGEVKEGKPRLNPAAREPAVLSAVLTRFGCCQPAEAAGVVSELLRRGRATTSCGHRVRYVVFGSQGPETEAAKEGEYHVVSLSHIQHFLQEYIREHWDVLRHAEFKDPVFGFLVMLEKGRLSSDQLAST
jgi:hypothetical protein